MKGLEEMGVQAQIEGAGGKAHGVIWIPVSPLGKVAPSESDN